MNVLLLTLGSHGDVHPFVGLALELRRRGHSPVVATNGHFESLCRGVGIDFTAIGTDEEFRKLATNKDLWAPSKAFKVVFGAVAEAMHKTYETVVDFVQQHDDAVVVTSSLGFAARVARDKFEFPLVTVHLQPGVIRSLVDPPKLPGLFMPRWLPMWIKRGIWEGGDKFVLDPTIGPPINTLRKEIGLPPIKRVMKDWWHSPDRVIGLFPEWFAPPAADWPRQLRLAGFPLWDEQGFSPISQDLETFLNAGDRPIAFTPGSAMVHGQEFFATAAEACRRIGRRGLLLTRHTDQLPASLPDGVIHVDYAPFSDLLPRCAAIVHHGGIGTMAQGLSAGIPQLIQPMAHDQFDNASRIERLGAGLWLTTRRFTPRNVSAALSTMLQDANYPLRAGDLARRFIGANGLSTAAELIEGAYDTRRKPRLVPAVA